MNKPLFSYQKIILMIIGTLLFVLLFIFVRIPSPLPETDIQLAYGISVLYGVLYGPLVSLFVTLLGHIISDLIVFKSLWWSWIIGSAIVGVFAGIPYYTHNFKKYPKINLTLYIWNVIGQMLAWLVTAPLLDVVMYQEPKDLSFAQGSIAFGINTITGLLVGVILVNLYLVFISKKIINAVNVILIFLLSPVCIYAIIMTIINFNIYL
jgi:energy-coupling factor transport system substrate-specific component